MDHAEADGSLPVHVRHSPAERIREPRRDRHCGYGNLTIDRQVIRIF